MMVAVIVMMVVGEAGGALIHGMYVRNAVIGFAFVAVYGTCSNSLRVLTMVVVMVMAVTGEEVDREAGPGWQAGGDLFVVQEYDSTVREYFGVAAKEEVVESFMEVVGFLD